MSLLGYRGAARPQGQAMPATDTAVATHDSADEPDTAPQPSTPYMRSKGSVTHDAGECKPCLWLTSKVGCFQGAECNFCHLSHPKKSRSRPCKAKRTQCKKLVGTLDAVYNQDPDHFMETVGNLAGESSYMRAILRSKMRQLEGGRAEPVANFGDEAAGSSSGLGPTVSTKLSL
eukprot:gnl/TRDRNA2_/TRDRNA2_88148_c1_seq1.p1 gnl/TRDRNA2_/TRDRNA2_88148_c1~~gnl/TRDRNA2_/TRDRNA2_88148_c1_seq1.p1  ORF type:complete len:174 (+),score=27.24 gnl/TRDRNA2_/TRDRNA2_88148_c1_seq1:2-523(+)